MCYLQHKINLTTVIRCLQQCLKVYILTLLVNNQETAVKKMSINEATQASNAVLIKQNTNSGVPPPSKYVNHTTKLNDDSASPGW